MDKEIIKELNIIKEKLGIVAYDELMNIYSKLFNRISELEVSRDNWRKKYTELKNENYFSHS